MKAALPSVVGNRPFSYNLEVVVSPVAVHLQDHVLSPLWDRLHPVYFRLLGLRGQRP